MQHSNIGLPHLSVHSDYRLLFIGKEIVKLTPTEYQIICCLLSGEVVCDGILAERALDASCLDKQIRDTLEKHINRLRTKVRPHELDILRLHGYGYILIERSKENAFRRDGAS